MTGAELALRGSPFGRETTLETRSMELQVHGVPGQLRHIPEACPELRLLAAEDVPDAELDVLKGIAREMAKLKDDPDAQARAAFWTMSRWGKR